jgi:translation initiation factor IF-2
VPLGWGEPFRPWWNRCSNRCWDRYNQPYAVDVRYQRPGVQPTRYVNMRVPGAVSAVAGSSLSTGQSPRGRHVTVPADQLAGAPLLASAPITSRPARSAEGSKPRIDRVPPAASTQYTPGRSASVPVSSSGGRSPSSNALPGAARPASSPPSTYPAPSASPGTGYASPNASPRPTITAPVQRETARPFTPPAGGQAAAPAPGSPPGQSGGTKPSPSSSRSERAPSQAIAPAAPAYVPQPAAVPRPVPAAPVQAAPAPVAPVQVAPAAAPVQAAKPAPAPPPRDDRRANEDKPGRSDGGRNDGVRGADKPGRDK